MTNKLDYVPSWVTGARTLLEKLDLCIAKIEEVDVTHATKSELEEISKIFTNNINQLRTEILAKFDPNSLVEIFEGSDTIIVGVNEAGTKIKINLNSDVANKIERSILLPVNALSQDCVPVVSPNKSVTYTPIDSIGAQQKVYYQKVFSISGGGKIISPPIEQSNLISYSPSSTLEEKFQALVQYTNGIVYSSQFSETSIVDSFGIQDTFINVVMVNGPVITDVKGTEQINIL